MTKTRNLSDLLDSNGDVKSTALDNVPASDVVNDTTPQLGGTLDTNGNPINFGDNDKAQFGASQDLQIFHDTTDSWIQDRGTGNLKLGSNGVGVEIRRKTDSADESLAVFNNNGSVDLYYDNSKKFETTSTGATVTGTLTATAFSGDGSGLTGISGGKVLQVVTATKTSAQSTSSSSFTDITGLSASITPSSTSSKILIQYVTNMGVEVGTNRGAIQLVRGTTAIAIGDTASNRARVTATAYGGNTDDAENLAGSWLDSPSTTSATTYKLQCRTTGVGSIHINRSANDADNSNQFRTSSSIILMEIGA